MDLSQLPLPAAIFVIVHTFVVFVVIVLVVLFVGADLPSLRRRRLARQSTLPKPVPADAVPTAPASPLNPLQCSLPNCRRTGEIFWQTRQGVITLCRSHALKFWESLNQFVQTLEREPE